MDARTHTLPFDPIAPGSAGLTMDPPMKLALEANFGSVEHWRDAFITMARAQGGGPGSMVLNFQPLEGTLVNAWCTEPAQGLAGGVTILALDMDAHGGLVDPGADAADPLAALMQNIDWADVYARYQAAVHLATESIGATAEAVATASVLDVRRAGVFEQAQTMLPQARWFDPAGVADWAGQLPQDREIVVYCVYGHEVGRCTALRLRAAGLNARYLRGGIDGWQAAGHPVVPNPGRGAS